MRKFSPLIILLFFSLNSQGQAVGGWGTCEFATIATMNAFDPSSNAYDCKKVYVQATDEHYHWDGTQWVIDGNTDNIYTTDGTLTGNRAVTQNNFDLNFDVNTFVIDGSADHVGVGTADPSSAKLHVNATGASSGVHLDIDHQDRSAYTIRRTDNSHEIGIAFENSGGAHGSAIYHRDQNDTDAPEALTIASIGNETNPDDLGATATFKNDGVVTLHDYGVANNQDNTAPYLLGVQADGDIVEVPASLAIIPDINIYKDDGTLTGNRAVTQNNFDLNFDVNTFVIDGSADHVGVGTADPSSAKLHVNATGASSGVHLDIDHQDRSAYTIRRTTNSHEIGIAFENSGGAHGSAIYHRDQNDADAPEALTIASIGNETNPDDLGATATFKNDGVVTLHDYGLANNQDNTAPYLLGVQADGDIVEVPASLAIIPDINIYKDDGTLTGNRAVTQNNFDLNFDVNTFVIDGSADHVGVGTADPSSAKLHVNATGASSGVHLDIDHQDRSAYTIRRTTNSHEIGIAFENSGGAHGSAIYHRDQNDADAPEALTIASIGNETNPDDLGATATFKNDGVVTLHDYGVANNQDNTAPYLLGVQADGDIVEVPASLAIIPDINIYKDDGTLTGNRAVTQNNFDLNFDANTLVIDGSANHVGVGTASPSSAKFHVNATGASSGVHLDIDHEDQSAITLRRTDNSHEIGIAFQNSGGAHGSAIYHHDQNDADTPEALTIASIGIEADVHSLGATATFKTDGVVRLHDYGVANNQDNTAPYLLGVQADGDIVEVPASLAIIPDINIYKDDGTLTGNRAVTQNNFDLNFDVNTFVIDGSADHVGVGTADPSSAKLHVNATGASSGVHLDIDHQDQSALTIRRTDNSHEIGIAFENSGGAHGSAIYHRDQNDADAPEALTIASIGNETNPEDLGATATFKNDGVVRLHDYGSGDNATGSDTYMLSVDGDGNVQEMNTVKSARVFFPPPIVIDASSTGAGSTNLYSEYEDLYSNPVVRSPDAAGIAIPSYDADELLYYITDYDTSVFSSVAISNAGVLTYTVDNVPADNCSFMTIVFVVK